MKILHIVENLDKGAVENWLVRMFEYGQSQNMSLEWTFFCVEGRSGRLDERVLQNKGKIIYSAYPLSKKIPFLKSLRKVIKNGGYEVLHSHHDYMSAFYLIATIGLPIKLKIIQIHNSDEVIPTNKEWLRKILVRIFRIISIRVADKIIGISQHTLNDFISGTQLSKHKSYIHYYGFNYLPYLKIEPDKKAFRLSVGFAPNDKIILFLSRMDKTKGPFFALEVIAQAHKVNPNIKGLFVGKGSLENEFQRAVSALHLENAVKYLGWSDKVPEIMVNSDLFILPHEENPKEGLGLVLLEAQAAGLPLLISYGISDDPIMKSTKFKRLSLSEDLNHWVNALNFLLNTKSNQADIIEDLNNSPFNMNFAINDLEQIYND